MKLVQDKITVITGGTRGIGFAAARKFIENGAKVAIFGETQPEVDAALAELKGLYPEEEVLGFAPNLASRDEVMGAVGAVAQKYGRLDVMINNAGVSMNTVFSKVEEDEFKNIVDVNLIGVFNGAWAAYQCMKDAKKGVIINTASVTGVYGSLSGIGYPTTKAGVIGLTHGLGREIVRKNIRVVGVAPGVVNTDMVSGMPQEILDGYLKTLPMKRMLEAEEIANVYMFLASDLASGITATTISVDGAYRP
ncbi:SDR family NAD(P)-dependent oxidoreductase [Proteocatella sphenisci]|uniref:SDR family NAD(P)-dependent oxidoreductase n=1 Tax=Proteocatella sphenisci TaxID=181070 RepID=UPI00048CCB08|nr:SDR family NAD(P)-dependent oxidoreductase [Proteocatella sphenisci]